MTQTQGNYAVFRQIICDELETNTDGVNGASIWDTGVDDPATGGLAGYILKMRKNKCWGDQRTLLVIASVLQQYIVVHQYDDVNNGKDPYYSGPEIIA